MYKHLPVIFKNKLPVSILFMVAVFFASPALTPALAQQINIVAQRNCAAMEVLERQLLQHPTHRQALKAIEAQTALFVQQQAGVRSTTGALVIPVVVHVVYNTSEQNISHEQVKSQLQALNEDFRRTNADADPTWPQAADTGIEFALATRAPNGSPTTGITRTATSITGFSTNDAIKHSGSGGKNAWPADSYLNIWVGPLEGNVLGYAQFPGGSASTDGVVIGYKYFGTSGTATAPFNRGRTTTHEVGHWLNLRHIWGDGGCSADDAVADTPPADAPSYGCQTGKESCGGRNMVQNYMDYSDDACMNLFTSGQKDRMQALLALGGARASLLRSAGLGEAATPTPACTATTVALKLVLDSYPAETSWELKDSSGTLVAAGSGYGTSNATINERFCLPDGCYEFIIKDAYGDGICCTYGNGSYQLTDASGTMLASGGNYGHIETKTVCVGGATTTPSCPTIDFNAYTITGFPNQDYGTHQVQENGATLYLTGNTWKQIPYNYTVTPSTLLEFEYRSTQMSEIQGIAFENDNAITPKYSFRIYGNQSWGISNYDDYSGTDWKKYTIPVGDFFTGNFNKLVFMGDDDLYDRQTSYFRNVKVYEGSCGTTRLAAIRTGEKAVVGTASEYAFGIRLFPNPATDHIYLELMGEKTAQAVLYNSTGKQVWTGTLAEHQEISVDVRTLAAGIYTLRILGQDGSAVYQKFIKK